MLYGSEIQVILFANEEIRSDIDIVVQKNAENIMDKTREQQGSSKGNEIYKDTHA